MTEHRSVASYWHAILFMVGVLLMAIGVGLWAAGQIPLVFVAGCVLSLVWLGIAAFDAWRNRP